MSPSENDLRAALNDGAGHGRIDVDAIVAGGRAIRSRRVRIASSAAIVAVVAAGGVGIAAISGSGNSDHPKAAAGAAEHRTPAYGRAVSPSAGPGGSVSNGVAGAARTQAGATPRVSGLTKATAADPSCPASAVHQLVPGGGSPGQFGSDDPLFAKPVARLVVCSYGSPLLAAKRAAPTRVTLTGSAAAQLVRSLEHASTKPRNLPCPSLDQNASRVIAFIGVTAGGQPLTPVTTTLSDPACNVQVTNGSAVRYDWNPSTSIAAELRVLAPTHVNGSAPATPIVPQHTVDGSPAR